MRRYWRDMSCEEIASELATPIGTVKIRPHRGRLKLGDALITYGARGATRP